MPDAAELIFARFRNSHLKFQQRQQQPRQQPRPFRSNAPDAILAESAARMLQKLKSFKAGAGALKQTLKLQTLSLARSPECKTLIYSLRDNSRNILFARAPINHFAPKRPQRPIVCLIGAPLAHAMFARQERGRRRRSRRHVCFRPVAPLQSALALSLSRALALGAQLSPTRAKVSAQIVTRLRRDAMPKRGARPIGLN